MTKSPCYIPERCHPLVKSLLKIIYADGASTHAMIEKRSGVCSRTFEAWKCRTVPRVDNLNAVGNVFGYELYWRKIRSND